jgi:ABC-type cobalamin/Fe3+-siderophores transport system ATPase subunit
VIGLNGSGKSSLLGVLASVNKEINGENCHISRLFCDY